VKTSDGKNVTNSVKCFASWQLSISSALKLSADLRDHHDLKFVFTRRLNQDPLENFFSIIRQKGGLCDNPTPLNFMRLLKQSCCRQLFAASVSGNSEVDVTEILATLTATTAKSNPPTITNDKPLVHPVIANPVFPIDQGHACLEENGLCGYLLRKLLAQLLRL